MLLALYNIFPYIFCTFQKMLFLLNCIISNWKCFLQAFSDKYLSDTFSLEKTNLDYKGGHYKTQSENNPKPPYAPQSSSSAALLGPPNHLPSWAAEGQDGRPHTPGRSAWPPSSIPCPWPSPARGHCFFAFATDCSSCIPPTWCWSAAHLQPSRHTQAEVSHLTRLFWGTVWKPWTCE